MNVYSSPRRGTSVLVALIALACAQPVPNGESPGNPPAGGQADAPSQSEQARDWAAIEALEQQAKAIVRSTGCSSSDGCRTAPVGNRACGGPRYYLVYCAATTDSAALYRKLDEIVRAENAYNAKYGVVSTCEFRMPPEVEVVGRECRAR